MVRNYVAAAQMVLALIAVSLAGTQAASAQSGIQLPVRAVSIVLKQGTQSQLFDELRRLSDANAFAIRIAPTDPSQQHFLIQLWREDIKGVGTTPQRSIISKSDCITTTPDIRL